ncbi:hypothetical protein DFP82_101173 [Psychrobacter fozii]|uniref:Uncharacterized protein n=1 Tax=Psychrobacter fozii TaxID=198480 RepID=A0A2V4V7X0_9GAMM|nr:hypothetical protein DFP82_101173 [Psychrobacter fozii]
MMVTHSNLLNLIGCNSPVMTHRKQRFLVRFNQNYKNSSSNTFFIYSLIQYLDLIFNPAYPMPIY